MEKDILARRQQAQAQGRPYVLCTIVQTEGATPRGVGSKMLVYADGTVFESIGGGLIESGAVADALACLEDGQCTLKTYQNPSADPALACSGQATVFFEPFCDNAPRLVVAGAGHVGAEVIRLARILKYHVTVIDTREPETLSEHLQLAQSFIKVDDFAAGLRELTVRPGTLCLVSTYSHATDGAALAAALEKDFAYIGMMGSAAKIAGIFGKLRQAGFAEEKINAVHTPIGLNIGGDQPEEIALAIMAEMQMVRYGGSGVSGCETRSRS